MATSNSSEFGIRLGNIPLLNLRLDFNCLLALFRSEHFRSQFRGHRGKPIPIETHFFTWYGRPEALLTYLVRDSIVALECAVSGAVYCEAIARGKFDKRILEAIKNPFKLQGKGTADLVFNVLPSLIDSTFSLEKRDPEKWERSRLFYTDVRNPLFHSYEIANAEPEPVWKIFEFIWTLFQWLNSWHNIKTGMGPIQLNNPNLLVEVPDVPDYRVKQIVPERKLEPNSERDANLPPDLVQAPDIEDVLGMYLPSEQKVCFTLRANDGRRVNMEFSAHAAMKLFACLTTAHQERGWKIPDRL